VLSFRWDEDAGVFTGRDAALTLAFVDDARAQGGASIHPIPCTHDLSPDPMRSRADLAAIFGMHYMLPSVWADALPVGDDGGDAPDGAVF